MANIGVLNVAVKADTQKFNRNIKQSGDVLKTFVSGLGIVAGVAAAAFAAFKGLSAGIAGVQKSFKDIDTTSKLADRLGVTTEALTGLQHAAGLAGIEDLSKHLTKMNVAVQAAGLGAGPASAAFTRLGLDAQKLAMMSPDQQFLEIADALRQVNSQGEKIFLASEIFGTRGTEILSLLDQGSDAIREQQEEAAKLGISFSALDGKQVEMANDSITRMGALVTGVYNSIAIKLAPLITVLANEFINWANQGPGLKTNIGGALEVIFKGLTGITRVFDLMSAGFNLLMSIGAAVKATWLTVADTIGRAAQAATFILTKGKVNIPFANMNDDAADKAASDQAQKDADAYGVKFMQAMERFNARSTPKYLGAKIEHLTSGLEASLAAAGKKGGDSFSAAMTSAFEKLKGKASQIFEATRTPAEKLATELKEIVDVFLASLIDSETMDRAVAMASDAFKSAQEALSKTGDKGIQKTEFARVFDPSTMALGGSNLGDKTPEKQLTEQKKTNEILQRILENAGLGGGVAI